MLGEVKLKAPYIHLGNNQNGFLSLDKVFFFENSRNMLFLANHWCLVRRNYLVPLMFPRVRGLSRSGTLEETKESRTEKRKSVVSLLITFSRYLCLRGRTVQ